MGMYDEIEFHADLPDYAFECRRFQTKALERCLDRYLVTKEGLLFLSGSVFDDELPDRSKLPLEAPVPVEFTGEMRLMSDEDPSREFTARFTRGVLDWIRLKDSYDSVSLNSISQLQ